MDPKALALETIKEYKRLADEHAFQTTIGPHGLLPDVQKANLYASLGILRALTYIVENMPCP